MRFTRLIVPISCFLLGTGSGATIFALQQAREAVQVGAGPVIEHTAYFAKPGLADRVYEQRIHASEVRQKIGLPGRSGVSASGWDGRAIRCNLAIGVHGPTGAES